MWSILTAEDLQIGLLHHTIHVEKHTKNLSLTSSLQKHCEICDGTKPLQLYVLPFFVTLDNNLMMSFPLS